MGQKQTGFHLLSLQLHPNAPVGTQGRLNTDGSVSLSWDSVDGAQAYVIHYGNANESDPHQAKMMGYSETTTWNLEEKNVPVMISGDKIYYYLQTFNVKGIGENDIQKADYLNQVKLGSQWSDPIILMKEVEEK